MLVHGLLFFFTGAVGLDQKQWWLKLPCPWKSQKLPVATGLHYTEGVNRSDSWFYVMSSGKLFALLIVGTNNPGPGEMPQWVK